jgi:hypothetical protein
MAENFDREAQWRTLTTGPYCSDPNCAYCKDLRETQEEVSRGKKRLLLTDDRKVAC